MSTEQQDPVIGETQRCWDHEYPWTELHETPEQLKPLLYSYDKLATDALDRIDILSPPKDNAEKCAHAGGRNPYELLKKHAKDDELLGQLWDEINTVPDWVDWDQIVRGQRVVAQYNVQAMLGLLFNSLLGGMGAWRIVETLSRTGGFGVRVSRRRLLETLQHFLDVTEDLESLRPGGKGYESTVQVRMLHSTVRRRLMTLEKQKPGYFDMETLGVPINDMHQIGTISVYSAAVMFISLPRQGIRPTEQQVADYIALWRYVAYLLGVPTDWMATPARAKARMESVIRSEVRPSDQSRALANNILTAQTYVPPLFAPREALAAHAYLLNGNTLATELDIARPRWYYTVLAHLEYFLMMMLAFIFPWLPASLQQAQNKQFRALASRMITDKAMGGIGKTDFSFQYVPQHGLKTGRDSLDARPEADKALMNKRPADFSVSSVFMSSSVTTAAAAVIAAAGTAAVILSAQ